nr:MULTISPECIES: alcohol dehydrogenase catalytic domain-containing protein [unclassified Halanaerobium]
MKVKMAGICGTDLEIQAGYKNFVGIPGHEFVGIVEKDPSCKFTDKRVTAEINIPCNDCYLCKSGKKNHCVNRKVVGMLNKDGAFSEYMTIKRENLHVIPEKVSDLEAVFIEPLAAVLEIPEKIHIKLTDSIIVLGDGKLGLLTAVTLHHLGYNISIIGKHQQKLAIAAEYDIPAFLLNENTEKYDIAIDTTGSKSGIRDALKAVKPEGTAVLKTTVADKTFLDLSQIAVNELSIIGSRCGPFAAAIRLLSLHDLKLHKLVEKIFNFDNALKAFQYAEEKGPLKIILQF